MSDLLKTTENLLAGNARFTVVCPESGERFTYHIHKPKQGRHKGRYLVDLLTGPNNTADYSRLGEVDDKGNLDLDDKIGTGAAGVPVSAALARWIVALAFKSEPVPAGIEVHHAGCCLRCGRVLTVPYPDNPYRIFGLGPECGAK